MSRHRMMLASAMILAAALAGPAFAGARYATSESGSEQRSTSYREAQRALDEDDWKEASRLFGKIASGGSDEADAALYWKAYADWKQQMKKEALDGLRKLLATYPKSSWADDAKALEMEIREGKPARAPVSADDEELKLYALDGLMQMDSDKAVPILEKILAKDNSLKIKKRALFVLSQSDSPRARQILLNVARTGQPMELRCEAVRTLGIAGESEDLAVLGQIARDTSAPVEVRNCVVEAYLISNRPEALMELARSDPDSRIRARAIDALGANGALPALRQLWNTEKDPAVKAKLLEAFGVAGDVDTLAKAARESTDPRLRRKAIEGLSISSGHDASKLLRQLYGEFRDPADKRKCVEALMVQGDAKALLEMFRAEKDPAMKKIILQQLSVMDDDEATKAILEVLGEK